jgi:hypothetical protein
MKYLLAVALLAATCVAASAQQHTYYDRNGSFAGQSSTYNKRALDQFQRCARPL